MIALNKEEAARIKALIGLTTKLVDRIQNDWPCSLCWPVSDEHGDAELVKLVGIEALAAKNLIYQKENGKPLLYGGPEHARIMNDRAANRVAPGGGKQMTVQEVIDEMKGV